MNVVGVEVLDWNRWPDKMNYVIRRVSLMIRSAGRERT